MSTSEFIFGHSADDAADRREEAHKIIWALLAAIALHLIVGIAIALSSGLFSSNVPVEEDKPVELTLVDLPAPTPAPSKSSTFLETDESKASVEKPKDQTFESNANSIGASEQPATGSMPLPSQLGVDRPNIDLESHAYSASSQGAQPQPSVRPEESPQPTVAPTATPQVDQLAMLTSTPRPTPQPTASATPQRPNSTYQSYKERTRLTGGISNRGVARINAIGTPLGRYQKMLNDAIGSHWYMFVENQRDLVSIGTATVTYTIDRSGRIKNLKVVRNSSNEAFANVCLRSFLEAKMPPMPDDVADSLPPDGLDGEMSFTLFAN